MGASEIRAELAERIERAFAHRLGPTEYTVADVEALLSDWWLGGEEWWLECLGSVMPIFVREQDLTEEQDFWLGQLVHHLDGISFDGRTNESGAKLYGIEKTQAKAWRRLVPQMTPEERAAVVAFLNSPRVQRFETNATAWWEWAASSLTESDGG